jgi:hypothetical protein
VDFILTENNEQIFRAPEEAPPCPLPPTRLFREVGEKWIFSSSNRSYGYGYEAVRIRVNNFLTIQYLVINFFMEYEPA